jgi:glutaredoxin
MINQRHGLIHQSVATWLVVACGAMACMPAWALYKVVGPDGKVTYTDRAPADQSAKPLKSGGASGASTNLPYALQGVVARYPVLLYTSSTCPPCDSGRQMLMTRGVPFTEKTVTTPEDARALLRAESTEHLPVLRIGQKQLQGYAQADWTSYLDAAGYPSTSILPAQYRGPQATPLTTAAPKSIAPLAANDAESANPSPSPAATPAVSAPPGFRF